MKRYLFWILGVLVVVGLLVWVFAPRAQDVETARVTVGRFERAIEEDGKTRLRDRYVVSTPLAGGVSRITLREGDRVEKGALIATVSPTTPAFLDARTEAEMRERVGAVEATSRRASVSVERSKAALEQANNELKRSEMLAARGFVSPNQNETARLNVRLREKELESARQDEDAANHELRQSRAALRQYGAPTSRTRGRSLEISAPVSGKVLKVMQQSEDISQAGTPVIEIGDPANLEVVVDVLTTDASQIAPGMVVQLKTDNAMSSGASAQTSPAQQGRVRLVEPAAFTKVSALGVEEQRVNVVVDIDPTTTKTDVLGDGFRVDVRIIVQRKENAVTVPVSAIYPVGDRSAVFVVDNGRAKQQIVSIVARNGVDAWVKEGLAPDTQVIVYPPTTLKDGARVAPRKASA
jgi:HlyD family secretion protein